jgi:hypothetical protein
MQSSEGLWRWVINYTSIMLNIAAVLVCTVCMLGFVEWLYSRFEFTRFEY